MCFVFLIVVLAIVTQLATRLCKTRVCLTHAKVVAAFLYQTRALTHTHTYDITHGWIIGSLISNYGDHSTANQLQYHPCIHGACTAPGSRFVHSNNIVSAVELIKCTPRRATDVAQQKTVGNIGNVWRYTWISAMVRHRENPVFGCYPKIFGQPLIVIVLECSERYPTPSRVRRIRSYALKYIWEVCMFIFFQIR